MAPDAPPITETQARLAFHVHLVDKAQQARAKHGPVLDAEAMRRLLEDRAVVRWPTELRFDAAPLRPNEFAFAQPLGFHPSDGYVLCVHPIFETRPDDWAKVIAYHVPVINYGPIVDAEAAEIYGAALLDLDQEAYYEALCALADEREAADA